MCVEAEVFKNHTVMMAIDTNFFFTLSISVLETFAGHVSI